MNDKVESISKEKNKSDGKLTNANSRIRKLCDELKEEKQMNENLMHNQKAWQTKYDVMQKKMEDDCKKKDKEINELQVCEYKTKKIVCIPLCFSSCSSELKPRTFNLHPCVLAYASLPERQCDKNFYLLKPRRNKNGRTFLEMLTKL